jgi:hypothetical protein
MSINPIDSLHNCTICLEVAQAENRIQTLCGHFFHPDCLTPWTSANNNRCPNCRAHLTVGSQQDTSQTTISNAFNQVIGNSSDVRYESDLSNSNPSSDGDSDLEN